MQHTPCRRPIIRTIGALIVLWCFVCAVAVRAQTLPFQKYVRNDGLLSDQITAISQDSKGYLWIGTPEGISIFDGKVFLNYTVRDGLGLGQVNMIIESKHSPGTMYAALGGGGVCEIRNGRFSNRSLASSFSSNYVTHIAEDSLGSLWCITADGLYRVESATTVLVLRKENASYFPIADSIVKGATHTTNLAPHPLLEDTSWDLSNMDGMPRRGISCSFVDSEGDLWIGTDWEGLWRLSDKNLISFSLRRSEPGYYNCSPAAVDRENHFWAISGDGLWEFWKEGKLHWHKYLHPRTAKSRHGWLSGVAVDPSENLWIAYTQGWLTKLSITHRPSEHSVLRNMTEFSPLPPAVHYPKIDPIAFAFSPSGHLFYGTHNEEILEYDVHEAPRLIQAIHSRDGINIGTPFALLIDRYGNLWDGSYGRGIFAVYSNGQARAYTQADGLPDLSVRALLQDRRGRIWAGTRRGGIGVLQGESFTSITMLNGLISNSVWSLTEDDSDRIWAATSVGLQAIDAGTFTPLPPGGQLTANWTGKCGVTPTGQLWWHEEGVAFKIYEYRDRSRDTIPPPVYVNRVLANGEEQELAESPTVTHDKNTWTIGYVGISLKDPEGLRYRYRIPEIGAEWSPPTRERSITLAGLSPGRYTFLVDVVNADGIHSVRPAQYVFSISPPFWGTTWFIGATAFVVCSSLYFLYRYRLNKLLEVERLRTSIATDLHDDIGTGLTRIALFADAVLREVTNRRGDDLTGPGGNVQSWLREIGTSSRLLVDGLNDIVWAVDPKNDSFENVLLRIKTLAGRVFDARGIDYEIHISTDLSDVNLSLAIRRQFFLVFKETVNNVIKHAGATHVDLSISRSDGYLVMDVQDNGIGFDTSSPQQGNGLRNMEKRARMLKGAYEISSEPGKGTKVHFVLSIS